MRQVLEGDNGKIQLVMSRISVIDNPSAEVKAARSAETNFLLGYLKFSVRQMQWNTARNAKCPCGSRKKYKKCCGRKCNPLTSPINDNNSNSQRKNNRGECS